MSEILFSIAFYIRRVYRRYIRFTYSLWGKKSGKMNYTYILKCSDGTLYTGWTNHLEKRIEEHNLGKGAKYTRSRTPVTLAYWEAFATKEEAMRREWQIKQMSRSQKLKLLGQKERPGHSE